MSKDRVTPCKFYVCYDECEKGREADMWGYCQTCDKYQPRVKMKYRNKKKDKLEKYKKDEKYDW